MWWCVQRRTNCVRSKADFAGRILPVATAVMERWAQLQATTEQAGRRLPLMDSLLAATAFVHGLTLVTRNIPDFKAARVPLLDPWARSGGR